MLKPEDFNTNQKPTWCPGCGNWAIWGSLKKALAALGLNPWEVVVVFEIGCSGNMANFVKTYGFHGLHGRMLPVAAGVKLANHQLTVVCVAGDGGCLGEGTNHFIHLARGNHDITCLIHNNQVYGLTTGQTSPTSSRGYQSKSTPGGAIENPLNPIALALDSGATFVARGFAGQPRHLTDLIKKAVAHRGFSVVDILQPCVTFNKVNTFDYYRSRVYRLSEIKFNPLDKKAAWNKAWEKDKIPIGVFYRETRPAYHEELPQLAKKALVRQSLQVIDLSLSLEKFV